MEVAIFDVLLDCTKAGRGLFRNGVYPRRGLSFGLNLQSRRNPGNSLTLPWPVPPPGIRQTESEKKSGEVAVLKRDDRYIYYLITKKKVSHKPTYENMQKSLEAMKTHCLNNGVTDISMPSISKNPKGLPNSPHAAPLKCSYFWARKQQPPCCTNTVC
nr:ADP-ribose glycohydrolase OARD1 isoform X2 [Chrysemys picta bellii]